MQDKTQPLIIIVAGEASGDVLGGSLMHALREHYPGARFAGVGGPRMQEQGLDCWHSYEELAVMGFTEVISHLPRLLLFRSRLKKKIIKAQPDLLIGIDAPDFNLGLEKKVRDAGIRTMHYVSPTVWAWRSGRVKTVARAANHVLCLFPFEKTIYDQQGVKATYTGHPMADEISGTVDPATARQQLGVDPDTPCIAVLPGSRAGEIERLADDLLGGADLLRQQKPQYHFLIPAANANIHGLLKQKCEGFSELSYSIINGRARDVMAASELVLCASGTATLEAMLVNRPIVAMYRFTRMSYFIARGLKLVKTRFFSLPNILAGEALIPELEQEDATAERVCEEALGLLDNAEKVQQLHERFQAMHGQLRVDAARTAAKAVVGEL